nr:retrotransposon protein, putative, Ty1-copia subclass [Tanacetum cinerariifolium]
MDQLHALGKSYDNDMAINLINRSLNKDFGDFVRNFNMHCVGKTVTELHALLIDYEKGLKDKAPTPQVLTIQNGRKNKPKPQANKKDKSKGKTDKNKKVVPYQPKPKHNPLKRKENPNKDQTCHQCHVAGHWKRNCPLYFEELRKKIRTRLSTGFKKERKLSYGEQYLQVGNGAQAAVEAIGVFNLVLPSGLLLKLNNCYYAPSIVRGVVSLSCLLDLGFNHTIASNGISVSLNGLFYFSVVSANALRSDRGGEYLSQEFKDYLKFKDYLSKNGIVQNLTYPYTPQHNGVSERRNRILLDMVRSMFNLTTLSLSFWDYTLESAVRILNMVPTKKVDKTPYEIWHGKAPNLSYLKVWGCEAYVKRDSADKLHQRSVKCIFVGYPKETMGYYFYFPPENKVIVARYGNFFEKGLISQKFSGRDNDLEDDHMDTLPSENT